MPRAKREEAKRDNITRKPMGPQLRMDVSHLQEKHPGKTFRWVNNEGGRVQKFMQQGWTPVEGESTAGVWRPDAKNASQKGSIMQIPVGRGSTVDDLTSVLMMIDDDLYSEMVKDKNAYRDEQDRALKGGADQSGLTQGEGGLKTYAAETSSGGLGYSEQ